MKHKLVTLLFAALCGTANIYAQTPTSIPDKPEVILVSGGTFNMGSNNGRDDEKPVHSVTLSSYSIGKYPVTVGHYKKFCSATDRKMPKTPLWGWNDKHPMVMVSYDDAVSYCNWLGKTYGGEWRLPTEAEWEYAARGGNKSSSFEYSGSNDMDRVGWYKDNSGGQPQSVGGKIPNELGIYDMSGNVFEWCSDFIGPYASGAQTNPKGASNHYRQVVRGGGWRSSADDCRVAHRSIYFMPGFLLFDFGFRVVLYNDLPDTQEVSTNSEDFSTLQKFVDALNSKLYAARINLTDPNYKFSVVGKTDFSQSSFQFIVKDNALYTKMNMPLNGNCDYGLKEEKVIYAGSSGTGGYADSYYFEIKHNYMCNGITYNNIYFTIKCTNEFYEKAKTKLKECCSN